jgi:hypothetical protein
MRKKDSDRLKPEHRVVLNALEVANTVHQRVATVSEVTKALSLHSRGTRLIKKAYSTRPNIAVAKILAQLHTRGIIFSPGVIGDYRYYGSERSLHPEARALPSLTTRRRRVLQLVRDTVFALGRAVRTGEVLNHATCQLDGFDISPELITRDILSLKRTGDLMLVESTLHRDKEGKNYYLPRELAPADFPAKRPLTWLEEVANYFKELWEERVRDATASSCLPRPVSSAELRNYILSLPQHHPNLQKRMFLVNALIQLSESAHAVVRKVRRPSQRAVLWVPFDVPDESVDLGDLFVSDAERLGEAVARAIRHLGRPVNVKDIRAEIKLDPMLHPASVASLASVISDLSKLQRRSSRQGIDIHYSRKLVRIFRAGRIDNDTYYYHAEEGLNDAKFFVQFEQLKRKWSACGTTEQMTTLGGCAYPPIVLGRALMIEADAKRLRIGLEKLLKTGHGAVAVRGDAECLLEQIRSVTEQVQVWLKGKQCSALKCPSEVNPNPPMWTAAELLAFLKPFYPLAQEITDPNKLIRLVFRSVRRIPNPSFRSRFKRKADEAAEYFFDRTDALLYAAQKWGGHECCFQSSMAASNLGLLRDARFVFPLLSMDRFDDRLTGIACLAFLQTKEAVERLKESAVKDPSSVVREAALWACGFVEGERANDLFVFQQKHDSDARIREFSKTAQQFKPFDWWSL